MLSTGKYSSVAINMYTNPECTDVAVDTSGNPIVNKSVLNLTNTTAHTDVEGNQINATATITFTDDSTLLADDETDLLTLVIFLKT
jgi:hypothetical protein